MNVDELLQQIKHRSEQVQFSDVIATIEQYYDYSDCEFTNGLGAARVVNAAGSNVGSCKIFAFGRLHELSPEQTLACFGDYYRVDVLQHPDGSDHQNIRTFMKTGWAGITFSGEALRLKA